MEATELRREILQAESALRDLLQHGLKDFTKKIDGLVPATTGAKEIKEMNENVKAGIQKVHINKESLLSRLMEINDYKTIYNMVAASFIPLTILIVIDNYNKYGELLDINTFWRCFDRIDKVLMCWFVLATIGFTVVPLVHYTVKLNLSKLLWIPLYLLHQLALLCLPTLFVEKYQPGFGACMIIMIEGARMMMKSHSYFRNKLLYCTDNQYRSQQPAFGSRVIKDDNKLPHFTVEDISTQIRRYCYFLICPSLIYRDNYSLRSERSFLKALVHFTNFFICLYYSFMVYMLCCRDVIEGLGKNLTISNFIISVLRLMLPSMLFLILGFFGFLHSWLNGWAQITRFPDRIFYLDWWNSAEFGTYYRKWNIVVHDWLYYYVYLDLNRFIFRSSKRSRFYSKIATFLISALIHELILIEASGFFYPVLFMMFTGPGIILIQNQKRMKIITNNFFFWIEMYLGTSLLFVLYLMEYYARTIVSSQQIHSKWGAFAILVPRTAYLK